MSAKEEAEPEGQTQDEPAKVDPLQRSALRGPGRDSEKALGLEMARLFGLPPRLLVSPPARPDRTPQDDEAADGLSEVAGDEQDGD